MALSNGFGVAGAAGAAGGGVPAAHGTTHQPNGSDPLGPLAGQSFHSATAPTSPVEGSVWVPSGTLDALRGEWLVWNTWRNSGSGRWVGAPRTLTFGGDAADGTFLEMTQTGPSADIAFVARKDMVILGVSATRSNDGPTTKTIDVVIDKNMASPVYSFSANKGTSFNSVDLDIPLNLNSLLGVRASAAGDPCRINVQVTIAVRRD